MSDLEPKEVSDINMYETAFHGSVHHFICRCKLLTRLSPTFIGKEQRGSDSGKYAKTIQAKDEDEVVDGEEEEEHGDTLCGACGENYASDEFWICCDVCEKWFHGKCVKITPAKAEHIKQYKCPSCSNKRVRT